MSFGRDEFS